MDNLIVISDSDEEDKDDIVVQRIAVDSAAPKTPDFSAFRKKWKNETFFEYSFVHDPQSINSPFHKNSIKQFLGEGAKADKIIKDVGNKFVDLHEKVSIERQ